MAKKQHYMRESERHKLEAFRRAGKGVSWIARELGFCRQTIYNELRRGAYVHTCEWWDEVRYSADKGQQVHEYNQTAKGRPIKLGKDYAYARFLEEKMLGVQPNGKVERKKRYSPAVALELARREGFQTTVCVSTLYGYIGAGVLLSPPEIIEELKSTAEFGMWGYTWWGQRYADAVKHWLSTRHGWDIQKDWIIQTNGVVQTLYASVRAFTQPGDNVLILTPVYYPFYRAVNLNGRKVVESPIRLVEGRYEVDFDDFEEKAKQCKMFLLCSPHNPMGRVWSEEELRRMGDICLKHNVLVVSDEIHFDIIMPGHKHVSYPTLGEKYANNCVMCCAASKTFSLAGLCVANAIIPNPELRDKLNNEVNISGCYTYSIFGLRALEAGYMKCAEWVDQLNEHIWGNYLYFKEFMARHFPEVWVAKLEGTYLCWFDCRCFGMDGETLAKFLQEKAQLFLDDGYIFGTAGDGFERINLACTRKVLEEALLRFKAAMDQR